MITCPKCAHQVKPAPLCIYCGAKLTANPLSIQGMDAQAWLREAQRVLSLGQGERALKAVENALKIEPELAQAGQLRAVILHKLGRGDAGSQPGAPPAAVLAQSPIMQAQALAGRGDHQGALALLDGVLADPVFRLASESAVVLVLRGCSHKALGRLKEALEDFRAAQRADPGYALALYNVADVYDDMGSPGDALREIDRALAIDPQYANAWSNRGYLLRKLRRDGEALQAYDKAVSLDPLNPNTWHNMGNLLAARGDKDGARACLQRALTLRPHPATKAALDALDVPLPHPTGGRPPLPPGRPGQTLLEALASRDGTSQIVAEATLSLKERGVFRSGDDIAVVNWILEVPPVTATQWGAASVVDTGVLVNMLLRDGTAVVVRGAGGAATLDPPRVEPAELRALAALVAAKVISRVLLVSDAPLSAAVSGELETLQRRLGDRGGPAFAVHLVPHTTA